MYQANSHTSKTVSKTGSWRETTHKQKNLSQIGEISNLPNTIQSSSTLITLKGAFANNPVLHTHIKHIDIQHHYIQDEVTSGRINLVYIPTELMLADGLT